MPAADPPQPRVLSPRARQHVLDRRGRRHQSASQAVSQPRSRLLAGATPRGIISLVLAVSIAGRLLMGWLADRIAAQARDAAHLSRWSPARFRCSCCAVVRRDDVRVRGDLRSRPRRRIPDHPADGGGAVRRRACSAACMGIVLTADGVAEATAPMLVGYLRDRTGSYDVGFLVARRRSALLGTRSDCASSAERIPNPESRIPHSSDPCASSTARSSSAVPDGISSR